MSTRLVNHSLCQQRAPWLSLDGAGVPAAAMSVASSAEFSDTYYKSRQITRVQFAASARAKREREKKKWRPQNDTCTALGISADVLVSCLRNSRGFYGPVSAELRGKMDDQLGASEPSSAGDEALIHPAHRPDRLAE